MRLPRDGVDGLGHDALRLCVVASGPGRMVGVGADLRPGVSPR